MAKKPLLWDTDGVEETERALEANAMLRATDDPNWIPGYSELERAAELARSEYGSMAYQQKTHQLRQLGVESTAGPPVHIKRVRVANLAGEVNDNVRLDMAQYQKDGYRQMTVADLERYGMQVPPLYHVAADGSIRRGDVALMFVDAQRAQSIRDRKTAETKERESGDETVGDSTGIRINVETSRDPNFSF